MNDLIKVTQLPVIEEHLRSMKEQVDKAVSDANALVCTEETVQSVKAVRTELSKTFRELEEQRKAVKAAVLGPYDQFEAIYKECVSDAFKSADAALKGKIDTVEAEIKQRCEAGLRAYFNELCAVHRLDFIRYEQAGITVDMASAKQKTPRKLRDQLDAFVSTISSGIFTISTMDCAEEIMVEFKRDLNVCTAIGTVQERHRRLEEERQHSEARAVAEQIELEAVAKVAAIAPPIAMREVNPPEQEEKLLRCTFTARATRSKLRKLKEFMEQEGILYE